MLKNKYEKCFRYFLKLRDFSIKLHKIGKNNNLYKLGHINIRLAIKDIKHNGKFIQWTIRERL